tara:strand:+ start:4627 stop:5646 length:1020 start_codon:yes stop_codon:yes gene_type:complete
MKKVSNLLVTDAEENIRVDRWFKRHFPTLSHSFIAKLTRTGQVRVDGARVKSSTRLQKGQLVRVPPLKLIVNSKKQRDISDLSKDQISFIRSLVIYMDDDIIVVNKPPGLAVQGGSKTLFHLDGLLNGLKFGGLERPKLVHRLDRDTSGIMLLARNSFSAAHLISSFRNREITKVYWALVVGVPEPRLGEINAPISKKKKFGIEKMGLDKRNGSKAISDFSTIETAGRYVSWLALRPHTGRTHQLRVHCSLIGTPILGDFKYGGKQAFIDGVPRTRNLHLHARSLEFKHPSGVKKSFVAPLSEEMDQTWQFFGFNAAKTFDAFSEWETKEKIKCLSLHE